MTHITDDGERSLERLLNAAPCGGSSAESNWHNPLRTLTLISSAPEWTTRVLVTCLLCQTA